MFQHHEWELSDRFATRKSSTVFINLTNSLTEKMSFPYLEFSFLFERKPEFFEKNLIVPTALISVLSEMTFLLPSQSGEKVGFSITVFLSLCVNLLVIASHVPASSESFPIIGQYYLTCIFLIAISIAQTTLILTVHFTGEQYFVRPIPKFLRVIFFDYVGPLVGYRIEEAWPKIKRKFRSFIMTLRQNSSNSNSNASVKLAQPGNTFTVVNRSSQEMTSNSTCTRNRFQRSLSLKNNHSSSASTQFFPLNTGLGLFNTDFQIDPANAQTNPIEFLTQKQQKPDGSNIGSENEASMVTEKLEEISGMLQDVVKYLQKFQRVNDARLHRFRLMEDWKLLSKILDRVSAIVYGSVTTYYTIYFLTASKSRPLHYLMKNSSPDDFASDSSDYADFSRMLNITK